MQPTISDTARILRRLRLVRIIAWIDMGLLLVLVTSALTGQRALVHVLGPIHGGNFLLLLTIVATAAADGWWSWWFPIGVFVTGGPHWCISWRLDNHAPFAAVFNTPGGAMSVVILWLIRYGHVLGGAVWVGGYALLALVIVPAIEKGDHAALVRVAINGVRVLTYTGMLTIFFGIVLITRTRGFSNLFRGEWGMLIITCFVIAIALLGVGDGALRPALRQAALTGDGQRARRFATLGLILTVLAIGLMTRALYART